MGYFAVILKSRIPSQEEAACALNKVYASLGIVNADFKFLTFCANKFDAFYAAFVWHE